MKIHLTLLTATLLLCLAACGRGVAATDIDSYDVTRPADELLRQVKRADFVVHEDGDVACGQELWQRFYEKTRAGESASVKLADYHTLDAEHASKEFYEAHKDEYPVIYLAELSFDGTKYTYRSINGLDGVNGFTECYPHLVRYDDYPGEYATFTHCERYVLVPDDTLTWERLQWGLYSSQMGDYIRHTGVYSDYQYKPEYAEKEKKP